MTFQQVLRTFLSLKIKEVQKPGDDSKAKKKMTRDERFQNCSRNERKVSEYFCGRAIFSFGTTFHVTLMFVTLYLFLIKQRQKELKHLEQELEEAAVTEDTNRKLRLVCCFRDISLSSLFFIYTVMTH